MSWLLDVNVLVAMAHQDHLDHGRVARWFASQAGTEARMGTCSITELGFVRVSVQAALEASIPEAVKTLKGLKASSRIPFDLLSDGQGASQLPRIVTGPKQVTDGHLLELARRSQRQLVTLDKGIPGAFLIPS